MKTCPFPPPFLSRLIIVLIVCALPQSQAAALTDTARAAIEADWQRQEQVTRYVERQTEAIRAVRPDALISGAVFPDLEK